MMKLVKWITKMQPFFNKISNNPYLRAIRDGFISLIPVILFSSIFLLIAFVPNAFGYFLPDNIVNVLMKAYSLSMGILAILMSSTIARSLTDNFNLKMPKTRQINTVSVMIASIISFLLLSTDLKDGAISLDYLGTKGLLTSFIIGFTIPNIYKFCVGRNITIKLPKEVPGNISQTFADIIPISLSVLLFWIFDIAVRKFIGVGFSEFILELFRPLFSAADGYIGLAVIFGAMAFFWFVGIHGPSIVEPAVAAIYLTNVEVNFQMFSKGEHATKVLSQGSQYFVATLGGTGATLVIIFMMAFIAKSKQLKAVGKASLIPGLFGVNEPILFGAPLVLNPVFFIPFIFTPIINVWLLKFFITIGMNGFVYNLPWTTPGPLGLIIGTGFSPLVFLLVPLLLVIDFIIYYPFLKTYDLQLIKQEEEDSAVTEQPQEKPETEDKKIYDIKDKKVSVLVLCANGATSGMLANAIAEGAKQKNMDLESTAMAYGQHKEILDQFDLIILAPQMASMLDELKTETDKAGIKAVSTGGKEYVSLTRNPEEALIFALKNI
ncbi:PTS lactose transporter subunit IIBC [Sebaldella sp. S0638]|uniref:PTS lactose transporter subunit IIBC n=1 Tax=Sebaldella sp. S0638 TaxID=2957809 RepID=UPI0020A1663E|nr:PTS lactose transporter subunit IIBC [Sebaldella sp. S0638]MCP1223844.1 PTS lactose transporter subunit IIBC [Sebaldella sp. S0638]